MNLSFYIAKRYLISKKSHNLINFISAISLVGITIGTMALIVVLSVFNGFEGLVVSLFNAFNPDLQITATTGKTFHSNELPSDEIRKIPGVAYYSEVVEEMALIRNQSKQYIATVKGVGPDFKNMTGVDTMMIDGEFLLEAENNNFAVFGAGVAYHLNVNLNDYLNPLTFYIPRRIKQVSFDPSGAFNSLSLFAQGIFSIQQDFDTKYVIVPLRFIRKLLEYNDETTSVEICISKDASIKKIQQEMQQLAGEGFEVKNRFQQQALLYKIMKSEKWAIFLILTFILIIAAFNMIGSLSMLILDKKRDIVVLSSLGANNQLIRRIFLFEGVMISLAGAVLGLIMGFIICWLQQKFGLITLSGSESFIINAYPVSLKAVDFILVFATVFVIGFIAAWFPVRQISKRHLTQQERITFL